MPRYVVRRIFHEVSQIPGVGLRGAVPRGDRAKRRGRSVGSFVSEGKAGAFCVCHVPTPPAVPKTAGRNELPVVQIRCESWTPASYS
jgi:hypothetical protein